MVAKKREVKTRQQAYEERVARRIRNRGEDITTEEWKRRNKDAWAQRAEVMRVNTEEKVVGRKMQTLRELEADIVNREQVLKDYFDKGLDRLGVAFDDLVAEQISAARSGDRLARQHLIDLFTRVAPKSNTSQSKLQELQQAGLKAIEAGRAIFRERTIEITSTSEGERRAKVYDPASTTDDGGDAGDLRVGEVLESDGPDASSNM